MIRNGQRQYTVPLVQILPNEEYNIFIYNIHTYTTLCFVQIYEIHTYLKLKIKIGQISISSYFLHNHKSELN